MDEALHLPPMKSPDNLDELLSGRGQEQHGVTMIAPVKAAEYTTPHIHKKKKEEHEEEGDQKVPHEMSDSNEFVKLEKPIDHPEINLNVGGDQEITPIDFGVTEDQRQAGSPKTEKSSISEQAQHKFEDFMDSASEMARRVEHDMEALLPRTDKSKSSYRSVEDEPPIRREGPLTIGQPVEIKSLRLDTDRGLSEGSKNFNILNQIKSNAADAAEKIGEFASKAKRDLDEGASKAKEVVTDLLNFDQKKSPEMTSPDAGKIHMEPIYENIVTKSPTSPASRSGCCSIFSLKHWDPKVLDLIYWRNPRKSGIVFGVTLLLLLSFSYFNIVTVFSYLGLIVLAGTLGYRVYAAVTASVNKTEQKNPFQHHLEKPVDLRQERAHDHVDTIMKNVKELINHLRRLFLVEDIVESVKFGLFLWALTYVGEYVSGTCLVILAFVGLFTLPKIYEMYQPQIDNYYNMAEQKVRPHLDTAKQHLDKVPYLNSKKVPAKVE